MSRAAVAAGAHGLLIEVVADGADRSNLKSDAQQGIPSEILTEIVAAVRQAESQGTAPTPGNA